jgi:hypothetical protein
MRQQQRSAVLWLVGDGSSSFEAHGARLDAKTKSGWTPLMLAGGVFFANSKKDYPAAATILKKAMAE